MTVLEGALSDVAITQVLKLLHGARKTGRLRVEGSRGAACVSFKDGYVVATRHPRAGTTVGSILMNMHAIEAIDLHDALARQQRARHDHRPLVSLLISLGRIAPDDGWAALRTLVDSTIAALSEWSDGHFTFEPTEVEVFDDFRHVPEPLRAEPELEPAAAPARTPESATPGHRPSLDAGGGRDPTRVLLVDDDDRVLRSMTRLLRGAGYAITTAGHAGDALKLAGTQTFDAALVDYRMPGLNGLELLHRLADTQPECVRLLMSGYLDLGLVLNAVNDGTAAAVLQKSFAPSEALATVEGALLRARQPGAGAPHPELTEALRACLDHDLLRVALQPIVNAFDADIYAFEALLRPAHPTLDTPHKLLEAAEAAHRVDAVAEVVLREARRWLHRFPNRFKMFVNMHPRELADPGALRRRVAAMVDMNNRLVLELTERERLPDPHTLGRSIAALRELGFGLAIDDLGAGYNSLALLGQVKADYVKIDRALVSDIHLDSGRRQLVETLIVGSKRVGALVVAEGVEKTEEAAVLESCGVDFLQGYLFGRPSLEPEIVETGGRFRLRGESTVKATATCNASYR